MRISDWSSDVCSSDLVGVGILVNSLIYLLIFIPLFLFIYQAIVLAEERFLRNKFGSDFDAYTKRVHRWLINPIGLGKTISGMHFSWKRWLMQIGRASCRDGWVSTFRFRVCAVT